MSVATAEFHKLLLKLVKGFTKGYARWLAAHGVTATDGEPN
jgi:hypothetical protein